MEPEREQERDLLHQPPPATEPVTNVSHANKSSATSDISQRPGDEPQRPIRQNYPSRLIGNQQRSFNAAWFDTYSWLEYSVGMDATFCFACRHFLGAGGHRLHSEPAFSIGYKNWKNATAAFKKHNGV